MKIRHFISALILLIGYSHIALGAQDSTLQISLLTCSPGQESYELYGHTALRVQQPAKQRDLVYNYGAFDFNTPHFFLRFALGKCDYMLAAEPFYYFLHCYQQRGSSVIEQVLNLTPEEATTLNSALEEESDPKHATYRYNILRNNCTTKARDIIEKHIKGQVIYPIRPPRHTFRSMLHHYQQPQPWIAEGVDLLLGADLDTVINERDEMFSPEYLMWYVDSAIINAGRGGYRPLVREKYLLLAENPAIQAQLKPSSAPSPLLMGWGLVLIGLLINVFELRQRRLFWLTDVVLMASQGLLGLLVCSIALFSVHPAVASNWQVIILNPLPLCFIYALARADKERKRNLYPYISVLYLSVFILLYFVIPQNFSHITLPLACLLLTRSCVHLIFYYHYGVTQS